LRAFSDEELQKRLCSYSHSEAFTRMN
jgi:hypothetical protein